MHDTVRHWDTSLRALHRRIAPRCRRAEPRQWDLGYLRELLIPVVRKNGGQLAEHLGERTPDGVQRRLNAADGDAERGSIEVGFKAAKQDCGLDDYEVRTWDAWHRHITLALLAHAFLVAMRTSVKKTGTATGLLPLTAPEIRRLLVRLLWTRPPDAVPVLAWSR